MPKIDFTRALSGETRATQALERAKTQARAELVEMLDCLTSKLAGTASLSEQLEWAAKEAAARAYLDGHADESQAHMIETEVAVTGDDPLELCRHILDNATRHHAEMARIAGLRRIAAMSISSSASPEQVAELMADFKDHLTRI